ncbi:hypothetical protein Dimus_037548, partial [Dionaea muscipula]
MELSQPEVSFSPTPGSSSLSPLTEMLLCHDSIVAGDILEVSSLALPCLGDGDVASVVDLVGGGDVIQGWGGAQSTIDAGEVLTPAMVPDVVQFHGSDKVSRSLDVLSSCVTSHVGGEVVNERATGRVGDGMVSEEGRVSSAAREALRPQHTEWLRQPLVP